MDGLSQSRMTPPTVHLKTALLYMIRARFYSFIEDGLRMRRKLNPD